MSHLSHSLGADQEGTKQRLRFPTKGRRLRAVRSAGGAVRRQASGAETRAGELDQGHGVRQTGKDGFGRVHF